MIANLFRNILFQYHQKKQDALKSPLGDLGAAQ